MKLIIDIPEEAYEYVKATSYLGWLTTGEYAYVIQNGIPLDEVKAEIDYERNRYLNLVGDSGYCNGLNKALKIIDNIGRLPERMKDDTRAVNRDSREVKQMA